jgi:hypothetical protein
LRRRLDLHIKPLVGNGVAKPDDGGDWLDTPGSMSGSGSRNGNGADSIVNQGRTSRLSISKH